MKRDTVVAALLFLLLILGSTSSPAQAVPSAADQRESPRSIRSLRPAWATAQSDLGELPPDRLLSDLTILVSRSPQQQAAFDRFTAAQQDPSSSDYHHWLTAEQVGEQFGRSASEIQSVTDWLRAMGLTVTHVSPGGTRIRFRGTAAQVSAAFQTTIHQYRLSRNIAGEAVRFSITSDPVVPERIASMIASIRGLSSIEEHALQEGNVLAAGAPEQATPAYTSGSEHLVTPADFAKIYDIPSSLTGSGVTVGIVAESRTNMADYSAFRQATGLNFANPTEVIPTAFGAVDPGPALTVPPPTGFPTDIQQEATMDAQRVAGTAPGAGVLLVVATAESGGIGLDAEYMVDTTPVPVNIMSISYLSCENNAGPEVAFWNDLFEQAAAEGISAFVASGDGGASCALYGASPTPAPAIAPNAICSSTYDTCMGGTEFNDASDPSAYWNGSNGAGDSSAVGYIPEGAWNEPASASGAVQIAATGGGVSAYIPVPAWQTGAGFPAAAAGRYTPDAAFSASAHDGYFICMAAGGGCGGPWLGTSATAPGMAGITALLDQQTGQMQGNLNPALYSIAATDPSAFHPVTVATSGVSNCSISVASMCNNSVPGPNGPSGGEAGYLLTDGYSEVTGLGSLDVRNFLGHFDNVLPLLSAVTTTPATIPSGGRATLEVTLSGTAPAGGASVTLASSNATLLPVTSPLLIAAGQNSATVTVSAGTATSATAVTLTATLNGSSEETTATVSPAAHVPTVALTLSSSAIKSSQQLTLTLNVSGGSGNPTPTGTVNVKFESDYSFDTYQYSLNNGSATITVAPGTLAAGAYLVSAVYTPDATSASVYVPASAQKSLQVSTTTTPQIFLTLSSPSVSTAQSLSVAVRVQGGTGNGTSGDGNGTPAGTVVLSSGSYTSGATTLTEGGGTFTVPANSLPVGTDTLTATYSGDTNYNAASAATTVTVTVAPAFTLSASPASLSIAQGGNATTTITMTGGLSGSVALTAGGLPNGVTASFAAGSAAGTQVLTLAASTSAAVTSSPVNVTVTGTSGTLTATATIALRVTAEPSFAGSSGETTTLSVTPGSSTGNTATVGVVGINGFSGTVILSCAVTTAMTGVNDMPACSLNPSSVSLLGTAAQTGTLTITTTAATSAASHGEGLPWQIPAGTALAFMVFWRFPRRRNWLASAVLLMALLSLGVTGCGGGSGSSSIGTGLPGTTAGSYTVTVTGTSGSLSIVVDTVSLTVQ